MTTNQIHLWVAYPDDLNDEATALACVQLLNEDERTRLKRFKFDRHRREQLATRVLGRSALSAYAQVTPEAWRFDAGKHGKPSIDSALVAQARELKFNLSNSLGLVVCAVSHGPEIGVDVEPFSRAGTIDEVAERFFSARELEQLVPLNGQERRERALTLWTLKEAYMKARGMGMALPTKLFSFVFEDGAESDSRVRLEIDPEAEDVPERWQFCTLDHAQHRIALMVESNSEPQIEVWEAHPILVAPKRVHAGEVKWHPGPAESRKNS